MKKSVILLFLFLSASYSFGQSKDTIYLKPAQVQKKSKWKTVTLKTNGDSSSLTGEVIKSAISRIDNIPEGRLISVAFYFNSVFLDLLAEKGAVKHKDLELGLLIWSANEDGTPGKPVTEREIRFTVSAHHRGALELDLDPLYLNTEKSMYFGFELLTTQTGANFRIMVKASADNLKTFYIMNQKDGKWWPLDFGDKNLALKMAVKVSLPKKSG